METPDAAVDDRAILAILQHLDAADSLPYDCLVTLFRTLARHFPTCPPVILSVLQRRVSVAHEVVHSLDLLTLLMACLRR